MKFTKEQSRELFHLLNAEEQDELLKLCRFSPQMEATLIYTRLNGYTRIDATRIVYGLKEKDLVNIDNYEERFKKLRSKAEERLLNVLNGKKNGEYTKLFKQYKQ